eukprot:6208863-Ditylum_brightwellii.AAC.1
MDIIIHQKSTKRDLFKAESMGALVKDIDLRVDMAAELNKVTEIDMVVVDTNKGNIKIEKFMKAIRKCITLEGYDHRGHESL